MIQEPRCDPSLFALVHEGWELKSRSLWPPEAQGGGWATVPVIRYSDREEALQRINRSTEGLGGSVWSNDLGAAQQLAARFESGTVWVNKHGELDPGIPFGGAKQSGLGTELGRAGVDEFTQRKVLNIAR